VPATDGSWANDYLPSGRNFDKTVKNL